MNNEKRIFIQDPKGKCVHSARQHPVYSDHYITDCGMVVTTSATRHETNHTEFVVVDGSDAVTCEECT